MQHFPKFNQSLSLPVLWAHHPMPTHPWRCPGLQWVTLLSAMWWGTVDQQEQWQHLLMEWDRWVLMGKVSRSLLTLLLTSGAFTPTTFGWLLCLQESPWGSTVAEQVEGHWTVKWVHDTRACISLYVYALWSCLHVNWVMKLCFFYFALLYVLFCIWVNLFCTFL